MWKAAAGAIKVQYSAHATGMDRLVSNMVAPNLNSKVNRSMYDPLLLSSELGRQKMISVVEIRSIMKLYKARIMSSPNLCLKRSTEEATVKLLDRGKVCETALAALSRIMQETSWQSPPPCQLTVF